MKDKVRFTEIDLLRFIAAFSVMFFHYTMKLPDVAVFSKYGYLGVDLFFLISGFVILMTAADKTAKEFVVSRVVRLYPAFWACCTITFFVAFFLGSDISRISIKRYLINMTMLHGFFPLGHVDGVYWTLFVEMKFYILIFILVSVKQIKNMEHYLAGWLACSLVTMQYSSVIVEYVLITKYSAYFISGALFYLIFRRGVSCYRLALLFGSYVLAISNAVFVMYTRGGTYQQVFNPAFVICLLTLFYLVFLLISLNMTQRIRTDFYLILGVLTYPLYLLHSHIWYVVSNAFRNINIYSLIGGMMVIMIFIAYMIHRIIEVRYSPVLKKWLESVIESNSIRPRD